MRILKNLIGNLKGFGGCPNCGDNWYWKESSSIYYEEGSGVLICKECLSNPQSLNIKKITKNLLKYKWPNEDVSLVTEALYKLKDSR